MVQQKRWVRKDRRVTETALCSYCGTCWGGFPNRQCPPSTCLACGSTQCLGNGLGHGDCSICYIGMLPGWSGTDRACGYKQCTQPAVAFVAGQVRVACKDHLERNGKAQYVAARLAERHKAWEETA